MKQPPNSEERPNKQEGNSGHGEPVISSPTKGDQAEKKSEGTKQESDDTDSKHTPSEGSMGWWKRKWEFIIEPKHSNAMIAIFSALLFFATLIYTVFAALQWCANKKAADAAHDSAKVASETLTSVQRAFLSVRGFKWNRTLNSQWDFEVIIENSGTTYAKRVYGYFEIGRIGGDPTDERFQDSKPTSTPSIDPKTTLSLHANPLAEDIIFGTIFGPTITIEDLRKHPVVSPRAGNIRAWGWIMYNDVFKNTNTHLSEFCYSLSDVGMNTIVTPNGTRAVGPEFRFDVSGPHNCEDEECSNYEEMVKRFRK